MSTIDITQVELKHLITHHVGNKGREEKFSLSEEETALAKDTKEFLLKYFLQPLKAEEFFSFAHPVKLALNEVFTIAEDIFSDPDNFISASQNLAKLLYEQSMHPKIKEGELNIAYFKEIDLDNETCDAIGIFKSETDVPFLKMMNQKARFSIHHDHGFEIKGIDKACVIFNLNRKDGYKILLVDNTTKSPEAQYWRDDFLNVKPVSNEFHQTKEFLTIAKNFVTKQLTEDFEVSKADQIDMLNRSVDYFKTHETFEKKDFEKEVFKDNGIIKSFRNFDEIYREDNDIKMNESFDISPQAVKKQARIFKSVLKLDKNFHIYIHGDRELIEQGVEKDGRKFYKIYFTEES